MDGLLTAVKTVHKNGNPDLIKAQDNESGLRATNTHNSSAPQDLDTNSPDNILPILRSKPDRFDLSRVLKKLDPSNSPEERFNIRAPGPKAAEILHVLISTTIPDHWSSLTAEHDSEGFSKGRTRTQLNLKAALLRCLNSVAGVGALIANIRTLIVAQGHSNRTESNSGNLLLIRDLVSVLSTLIKPQAFLLYIYTDIARLTDNTVKRQIMWKELTALVGAGRILSTVGEALAIGKDIEIPESISWVGDGKAYASWLGRCICFMASNLLPSDADAWKSLAVFYGRALSLGYTSMDLSPFPPNENTVLTSSFSRKHCGWRIFRTVIKRRGSTTPIWISVR